MRIHDGMSTGLVTANTRDTVWSTYYVDDTNLFSDIIGIVLKQCGDFHDLIWTERSRIRNPSGKEVKICHSHN